MNVGRRVAHKKTKIELFFRSSHFWSLEFTQQSQLSDLKLGWNNTAMIIETYSSRALYQYPPRHSPPIGRSFN